MLNIFTTQIQLQGSHHQPIGSVELQMSKADKKRVLTLLQDQLNFRKAYKAELKAHPTTPPLYTEQQTLVDNDTKAYTVDQLCRQLVKKLKAWDLEKNHIYKSYILRYNNMICDSAEIINKRVGGKEADSYINTYYINYDFDNCVYPTFVEHESLFEIML